MFRQTSRMFSAALLLTFAPMSASFAQSHSHTQTAEKAQEVTLEARPVAGSISVLRGVGGFSGGNVAVSAGPDGLLIVDSKLAPMTGKLREQLAALKTCAGCGRLRFVINTHWHFDHVGGNQALGRDALIVAHDNVRRLMAEPQRLDFFDRDFPAAAAEALPVVTFAEGLNLHFNGEEVQLRHLPNGHSESDSIVYFPRSGVLHTGDIFFNGMFPFLDSQHGGDVRQLALNVARILKDYPGDTIIIPGHGPVGTMADMRAYLEMLTATTAHVEAGIKQGLDLEALKQAGLPPQFDSWAWLIDQKGWTTLLHASLTAKTH